MEKLFDTQIQNEYKELYIESNRQKNELQSMVNSYNLFLNNMFVGEFNANDFFHYATAHSVCIDESDFDWVLHHIQKWGQSGMNACVSYIQNQTPIKPHLTEKFNKSLSELIERNQKVNGDLDNGHLYNANGPYRKINKYE